MVQNVIEFRGMTMDDGIVRFAMPKAVGCQVVLPAAQVSIALVGHRVTGERNEFPFLECEPAAYARGWPIAKWAVSLLILMAPYLSISARF